MNGRWAPSGAMIFAASILAAPASAQSGPVSDGSGPIFTPTPCTNPAGCNTISTGTGNDYVTPGNGNNTVTSGGPTNVVNTQSGGPVSDVPEPGSWGMMMLGFGFIGGVLRRDRRRASARAG